MITSMQRHEHSLLMVVRLLNKVENSMANGDSDPREQFLRLERCYQYSLGDNRKIVQMMIQAPNLAHLFSK